MLKNNYLILFTLFWIALAMTSCAVISKPVRDEALPSLPFKSLIREAENHIGKTVILGGYIITNQNISGRKSLIILQTPLSLGQEPKGKDYSEGRFILHHQGFLDPEVYAKDRKITVAGIIKGSEDANTKECPNSCLVLQAREFYLWPERYDSYPYYMYPYYDGYPFYYPYPYFYYPYRFHPHSHPHHRW